MDKPAKFQAHSVPRTPSYHIANSSSSLVIYVKDVRRASRFLLKRGRPEKSKVRHVGGGGHCGCGKGQHEVPGQRHSRFQSANLQVPGTLLFWGCSSSVAGLSSAPLTSIP